MFIGSSLFGCSPSFAIVLGASDFLWLELSCRCSNRVSSTLKGFSTVMGVMGLELELLA